jgi:superfamily I DNA/RNA helicase
MYRERGNDLEPVYTDLDRAGQGKFPISTVCTTNHSQWKKRRSSIARAADCPHPTRKNAFFRRCVLLRSQRKIPFDYVTTTCIKIRQKDLTVSEFRSASWNLALPNHYSRYAQSNCIMATLIPSLDRALAAKQKPTTGEIHLLQYLRDNFDEKAQVYFQPCINGDRPDVVILKEGKGVVIIEVKDWNLASYDIDENNRWTLQREDYPLRSPCAQVFHYKQTFFNLHINGLLEKAVKDKRFYGLVDVFVYFHGATRTQLDAIYASPIDRVKAKMKVNAEARKENKLSVDEFKRKDDMLQAKVKRLERDRRMSLTAGELKKVSFSHSKNNDMFNEHVYTEFLRLLSPPFHYANQGESIEYTKKQASLCESRPGMAKIRGLAGSGKTTVLAMRAVSAHQRHEDEVLVLTFNMTLRMYIHDKLSEVRGDFRWDKFQIRHYHGFITTVLANAGIDMPPPPASVDADSYYEKNFFSNVALFERLFSSAFEELAKAKGTVRYKTILIDEVQDHKIAWLEIIKRFFLEADGELVLFGDEKQNIYNRPIDEEKRTRLPSGFGKKWETLNKSFRYKKDSHILTLANTFQKEFLAQRYDWDMDASLQPLLPFLGVNAHQKYDDTDHENVTNLIFQLAKRERVHPNDISILGSQKSSLQEIDYHIRHGSVPNGASHRERTITTFASKELTDMIRVLETAERYRLQPYGAVDRSVVKDFPGGEEGIRQFLPKLHSVRKLFKSLDEAKKKIKDVEKQKKYGFNLNSGVMKLSTTHSFKGFESPTIVLLIGERDEAEMVYTGITRARENILLFIHEKSPFRAFFESTLEPLNQLFAMS